jgi:ABC-2 type transport system permease protein/lipopolysaccharide transport system permease protein
MSNSEPIKGPSWFGAQIKYALDRTQFRKALSDILDGWSKRNLWTTIGLHDVRQRYRRSVIGPFWITISTGIMIGALGLLYGQIFKIDTAEYLPFLAAGFFAWGLISNLVIEGCQAFNSSEHLIKQLSAPLSIYVYRVLWSNLLTAAHNVWIFVLVALWYSVGISWSVVLLLPALALILVNGLWVGLLLGLLSARFRDIPLIVASVMQVMFFITPIMWKPDMLPGRALLLDANPFYHFVEILRAPMLGQIPSAENWLAALSVTLVGWVVALTFYTAYRWRIAYWV